MKNEKKKNPAALALAKKRWAKEKPDPEYFRKIVLKRWAKKKKKAL